VASLGIKGDETVDILGIENGVHPRRKSDRDPPQGRDHYGDQGAAAHRYADRGGLLQHGGILPSYCARFSRPDLRFAQPRRRKGPRAVENCGIHRRRRAARRALAQTYPSKPIRLVVPFAPGGSSSIVARAFSAEMSKVSASNSWSRQARRGGNIAMEEVARADPDGYTLIIGHVGRSP